MMVTLDGRRMTTRALAHDHLAAQLALPDWYGRNLDALYDLLTAGVAAQVIHLSHADAMREALGAYGRRLLQTLQDAAAHGGPALELDQEEPVELPTDN